MKKVLCLVALTTTLVSLAAAQRALSPTDPFGNFLTQGYEFASARNLARLGNLHLQDGMWNGERILPGEFVRFGQTLAPAWKADGRPIYGGFFWLSGDGDFPAPKGASGRSRQPTTALHRAGRRLETGASAGRNKV
ncbi:MAG TPA: hypothetical protein VNQ79_28035 [Blastocatellia bacterium]|nr:hypothetical protein [Blastocatellia bacterium]